MNYHKRSPTRVSLTPAAAVLVCVLSAIGCGSSSQAVLGKMPLPDSGAACAATGQPCTSNLGCQGTFACVSGQLACQAPVRNNCGICAAADEPNVGAECSAPDGRPGWQVCSTTGGTVCASTIVSLTVDDTYDDAQLLAEMFEAHHMIVTFFVNSPRFGFGPSKGYLTIDQVLALQQKGHEIGGHTLDHPHLPAMTNDEVHFEICHDRTQLLKAGLDIKNFAYPFGAYGQAGGIDVRQTVQDCGYNSARMIGGIHDSSNAASAELIPPHDAWAIRTPTSLGSTTTLDQMMDYVRGAQRSGGWIVINMHHVCPTVDAGFSLTSCTSDNRVAQGDLNAFLDWLEPQVVPGSATAMQTPRQMLWGATQPGVDWAMDRTPGTNLLQNPSLEVDAATPGIPDCWDQRGDPKTTTWTGGTAHSGMFAEKATVTNFISGSRGLMTRRTWLACTPLLKPGRQYTLKAWYIAPENKPLFQVDFADTQAGPLPNWLTWKFSDTFDPSTVYVQAVWKLPMIPPEVEQVSVGLLMNAQGSLTVDDLELVEESQP